MASFWKKAKKFFEKGKKKTASETVKAFHSSKESWEKEVAEKTADLHPKIVEIYRSSTTIVTKKLLKAPSEPAIKENPAATQSILADLAKAGFPGAQLLSDAGGKVGPALIPGPIVALFEKTSTFLVEEPLPEEPRDVPTEVTPQEDGAGGEKKEEASEEKKEVSDEKKEEASEEKKEEVSDEKKEEANEEKKDETSEGEKKEEASGEKKEEASEEEKKEETGEVKEEVVVVATSEVKEEVIVVADEAKEEVVEKKEVPPEETKEVKTEDHEAPPPVVAEKDGPPPVKEEEEKKD